MEEKLGNQYNIHYPLLIRALFFLFEGCLCQFFLNCSSQKYLAVRKMYELLKYNNLKLSFHLCKS